MEIYVYDNWLIEDVVIVMIKLWVIIWCNIKGLGDNVVVECIWVDEIDILVDLNGYIFGYCLGVFVCKLVLI